MRTLLPTRLRTAAKALPPPPATPAPEKAKRGVLRALGRADQGLLRAMRTRAHSPATVRVASTLGYLGEWAAVWVAIGGTGALVDPVRRERWAMAAATGPAAVVLNYMVKVAVGRERPLIEEHPPLAKAPSKLSFPSAHSTSSVAAAVALARVEPGARVPFYALAAAICACRPFLGMHYPSDVLAGVALGAALGRAVPGLDQAPGPDGEPVTAELRVVEVGDPSTNGGAVSEAGGEESA